METLFDLEDDLTEEQEAELHALAEEEEEDIVLRKYLRTCGVTDVDLYIERAREAVAYDLEESVRQAEVAAGWSLRP